MRSLIFLTLLIASFGYSSTKTNEMIPNKLNGTWVPVKQEMGGKELPAVAFAKQKLIIDEDKYTVIAESVDKGEVKYTGDKMDIYGKDGPNAGKHFTALYKYENEELTICYNLIGDGYPETFDSKGKPMFFLSVFKKEVK